MTDDQRLASIKHGAEGMFATTASDTLFLVARIEGLEAEVGHTMDHEGVAVMLSEECVRLDDLLAAAEERERGLRELFQGIVGVDLTGGHWTPSQLHALVKNVQQALAAAPEAGAE